MIGFLERKKRQKRGSRGWYEVTRVWDQMERFLASFP